jgi:hypothetical protein
MTDFGDICPPQFPLQRGALGDEIQAADYKRWLDGRVPNISYSSQDSLARVSLASSEKRRQMFEINNPRDRLWHQQNGKACNA